jgi:hypothetical protein
MPGRHVDGYGCPAAETHEIDALPVCLGAEIEGVQSLFQVPGLAENVEVSLAYPGPPEVKDQDQESFPAETLGQQGIPPIIRPLGLGGNSMAEDQCGERPRRACWKVDFPPDRQPVAFPGNLVNIHNSKNFTTEITESTENGKKGIME